MRACVRSCVRACVHACVLACVCACVRGCVDVGACASDSLKRKLMVCVCLCVYACACACVRSSQYILTIEYSYLQSPLGSSSRTRNLFRSIYHTLPDESFARPSLVHEFSIDTSCISGAVASIVTPSEQTGLEGCSALLYATTVQWYVPVSVVVLLAYVNVVSVT